MAKHVASADFRRQIDGYGLTTAQILYRLPYAQRRLTYEAVDDLKEALAHIKKHPV